MRCVRTRFAPSPTGTLHIGGVRTALYNYLLARQYNGQFILRIEDTDSTRFVNTAEQYIIDTLKWLNIMPDEGIINGGSHGPYRQSERKQIYNEYAEKLVSLGQAYYAFDTPEELDDMHKRLLDSHSKTTQYDQRTRLQMKNSLTLSKSEVEELKNSGVPYVIRFKVPDSGYVRFQDKVRGWIKVDVATLDDKVLLKSDGMATYHLASIVDDYIMEISHVIRGEEWLPSAPIHVLMYQAFGWENTMPEFVHLPLLLKPDGQGKLSKRDAEEHGLPIFPLSWVDPTSGKTIQGFRELGYTPEALINFLALMGWNPGDNRELLTVDELIKTFSLEHLCKAGARFNIKKAIWFNHQYIANTPNEILYNKYIKPHVDHDLETDKIGDICNIVKERAKFTNDIWEQAKVFFYSPKYDRKVLDNYSTDAIIVTGKIKDYISNCAFEDAAVMHNDINKILTDNKMEMKDIMPILRIALFGVSSGPDVVKSMLLLGKNESLKRINYLLQL